MERNRGDNRGQTTEGPHRRPDHLLHHVCLITPRLGIGTEVCQLKSVTLCSAANILGNVTKFNAFFAYVLNVCGTPTLVCVVGNHLLIHLREAGDARVNEGTSYRLKTISALNFDVDDNVDNNTAQGEFALL